MINSKKEIEDKKIFDSYEIPNKVQEYIPNPIVSVRTSAYQHAKYIINCIEGVLMQKTTFPIEYIIGEDFSTDGTREIVFDYAKKYPNFIRVITADYNVGMKANGNRCIRACRGKYMAICEGDDYWIDPLKLQKQVDFLEQNPEYGLVYTEIDVLYQNSNKIVKKGFENLYGLKVNTLNDFIVNSWFLAPCTWVFCSKFIQIHEEFYEKYVCEHNSPIYYGDISFLLCVAGISKIGFINETTAVYRIHSGGISQKRRSYFDQIVVTENIFKVQLFYAFQFKLSDDIIDEIVNTKNLRILNLLLLCDYSKYIKVYNELKQKKIISKRDRLIYYLFYFKIFRYFLTIYQKCIKSR